MAAVAAHVHRHVFHDAQNRHPHLLEHLDALLGIEQRNILRRGHHHGAGHGHALRQRELDVAGAGRHVHDQVVQLAPVGLAQQLLQRLGGHGATPDHGLVLRHQETDRHHLHAVVLQRLHGLTVCALGPAVNAHHHRHAGAIDVGIEQAHAGPFGGQGQRQVDRGGALAHATLARGHRHNVFHLGQQLHATLHRVRHDAADHIDRHVINTRHTLACSDQCLAKARDLALGRVAQLHLKGHIALMQGEILDRFGRDKVPPGIGIDHTRKCAHQRLFCHCHSISCSPVV